MAVLTLWSRLSRAVRRSACERATMSFAIRLADPARDSAKIEGLLSEAYVSEGFTEPERAKTLFVAQAIFERGRVLVAHDRESLAGMVIVVPASSKARRFARSGESEMHLLAVAASFRRRGAGTSLVRAALALATREGNEAMLLWTQSTMASAQRLYVREGFTRAPSRDFDRGGRKFLFFERRLSP
jgi:ribosomal protein S18 acetylase RimI-like enzyme